jgi:hypothetical protein
MSKQTGTTADLMTGGGLKPAGAFLNRNPNVNSDDPTQPPVQLTETEQVQLECDNNVLEVSFIWSLFYF